MEPIAEDFYEIVDRLKVEQPPRPRRTSEVMHPIVAALGQEWCLWYTRPLESILTPEPENHVETFGLEIQLDHGRRVLVDLFDAETTDGKIGRERRAEIAAEVRRKVAGIAAHNARPLGVAATFGYLATWWSSDVPCAEDLERLKAGESVVLL